MSLLVDYGVWRRLPVIGLLSVRKRTRQTIYLVIELTQNTRTWSAVTGEDLSWLNGIIRTRAEDFGGSEVPVLLLDPNCGGGIADELGERLGWVYYAVKAGPYEPLMAELARRGHGMDIASVAEARLALKFVRPVKVICTNPILPRAQLTEIISLGVRVFVLDDLGQAQVLAEAAGPLGVRVGLRILVRVGWHDKSAAVALAEKFGVPESEVPELVSGIRSLGLHVAGLSFHLGSQSQSLETAAFSAKEALALAEFCGIDSPIIDVGGGFPVGYIGAETTWREFAGALAGPLKDRALVWCEPGRVLSSAGTYLVASVIGTAVRGGKKFVHLNAGAYHGLLEASTLSTSSLVPPTAIWSAPGGLVLARLTGPTCDSADMVFPYEVPVPENVAAGDVVVFYLAGAYSLTCSTAFNGFEGPLLEEIST